MADPSAAGMARLESRDAAHAWLVLRGARALVSDSRSVTPGDAFVAWPGRASDGRRYVGAALAAGASACLVEAEGVEGFGFEREPRVGALRGLKAAAGEIASRFLGTPSAKLDVVAVTGTNGKTSTAWWIAQALGSLGRRCGVIGTLGVGEPPRGGVAPGAANALRSTGLTTPDPIALQNALHDFATQGFAACRARRFSLRRARRFSDPERADHAAASAERGQRLRDPPRRRGLAVGAGDGDDVELGARVAEKAAGDVAGRSLQAAQRADARIAVESELLDAFGLDQAGTRAGIERGGDEAATVAGVARPGDEGVAGLNAATVRAECPGLAQRQPGVRRGARLEVRHPGVAGVGH